jgi:hypothetical protein
VLGTAAATLAIASSVLAAVGIAQGRSTLAGTSQLGTAVVVAAAAVVPLLGWVWVARRNAGLLAPELPFRFGPLAAAIAVAGPVSNLWWARPVLLEIAAASAPPGQAGETARLVRRWWTCLIGGVGSYLAHPVITELARRVPAGRIGVWAEVLLAQAPVLLVPAAAVLFALLLHRIGRWQAGRSPDADAATRQPDTGAVRPGGRTAALAFGALSFGMLATGGVAALVLASDGYVLAFLRPYVVGHATIFLITAAFVAAALVRLVLQPPAGSRMLATALCWAAMLGLVPPAMHGLPEGWDVAGAVLLVAAALAGVVAADRTERSGGVSRRRRSGAG